MANYYNAANHAFYNDDHDWSVPPSGSVAISRQTYDALMAGQSQGKVIVADANGNPILVDPAPPSTSFLWADLRDKRDRMLAASDWTQVPDTPLDHGAMASWAAYRTALRNLPNVIAATTNDPTPGKFSWPTPPA